MGYTIQKYLLCLKFRNSLLPSKSIFDLFLTPDDTIKLDVIAGNEAILFLASRLNFINSFAPLMRVIIP